MNNIIYAGVFERFLGNWINVFDDKPRTQVTEVILFFYKNYAIYKISNIHGTIERNKAIDRNHIVNTLNNSIDYIILQNEKVECYDNISTSAYIEKDNIIEIQETEEEIISIETNNDSELLISYEKNINEDEISPYTCCDKYYFLREKLESFEIDFNEISLPIFNDLDANKNTKDCNIVFNNKNCFSYEEICRNLTYFIHWDFDEIIALGDECHEKLCDIYNIDENFFQDLAHLGLISKFWNIYNEISLTNKGKYYLNKYQRLKERNK